MLSESALNRDLRLSLSDNQGQFPRVQLSATKESYPLWEKKQRLTKTIAGEVQISFLFACY